MKQSTYVVNEKEMSPTLGQVRDRALRGLSMGGGNDDPEHIFDSARQYQYRQRSHQTNGKDPIGKMSFLKHNLKQASRQSRNTKLQAETEKSRTRLSALMGSQAYQTINSDITHFELNRNSSFKAKAAKTPATGNYHLSNLGQNTLDRSGIASIGCQLKEEHQKSVRIMRNQTIAQPARKPRAEVMRQSRGRDADDRAPEAQLADQLPTNMDFSRNLFETGRYGKVSFEDRVEDSLKYLTTTNFADSYQKKTYQTAKKAVKIPLRSNQVNKGKSKLTLACKPSEEGIVNLPLQDSKQSTLSLHQGQAANNRSSPGMKKSMSKSMLNASSFSKPGAVAAEKMKKKKL